MRRSLAALALAAMAVAGVVGFTHNVRPGPGYTGGLQQPAAVQGFVHAQQTDPDYMGG